MPFERQRIRDPLHNLIEFKANQFENVMWRVLETRPFQRLRRVRQLGFSDLVYPGATHTRFAHSIGVFHTARQLVDLIYRSMGSTGFEQSKAHIALAAALLHDLGHGPFSHAFEEVGRRLNLKLAEHERLSDTLIRDGEISKTLSGLGSGFASDVADLVSRSSPKDIYGAVVSSQFDADRLVLLGHKNRSNHLFAEAPFSPQHILMAYERIASQIADPGRCLSATPHCSSSRAAGFGYVR